MEYTGQMSWLHTHLFVCAGVSKGRSGGQYKNKISTNMCVRVGQQCLTHAVCKNFSFQGSPEILMVII